MFFSIGFSNSVVGPTSWESDDLGPCSLTSQLFGLQVFLQSSAAMPSWFSIQSKSFPLWSQLNWKTLIWDVYLDWLQRLHCWNDFWRGWWFTDLSTPSTVTLQLQAALNIQPQLINSGAVTVLIPWPPNNLDYKFLYVLHQPSPLDSIFNPNHFLYETN